MKKLMILVIFFCTVSAAVGDVSTRVCEADGNTPFDGRDIMVGTKLTIIIESDTADYWVGDLFIAGDDRNRGYIDSASAFPAAGAGAFWYPWEDDDFQGYCFETDDPPMEDGDWFIADYNAIDVGDCNVGLHEWWNSEPSYTIEFTHVPTPDYIPDNIVNFEDFSHFALYWQEVGCTDPNWCEGADLNIDGYVDPNDLKLFVDYWLEDPSSDNY